MRPSAETDYSREPPLRDSRIPSHLLALLIDRVALHVNEEPLPRLPWRPPSPEGDLLKRQHGTTFGIRGDLPASVRGPGC